VGINVGIAGLLAAAAPAIAGLYAEPRLAPVVMGLSLSYPLNALAAVPRGLLMRRLDFRAIFGVDLIAISAGAALTVAAATADAGVASLVAGQVLQAAVTSALLLLRSPWRPSGRFTRADLRGHASFSGNLLAFNAVNYWARNADNLLIGRVLGAAALGYYERAYLLFLYPVSQITATLGRVMLSWLARVQDDLPQVRRIYLRAVAAIAFVTAPLMLGLSAVAEPFVLTVFGDGWRPTIPVLAVLSALGAVQAVTSSVGFLYQSQGRTDLMFRMGLINSAVIVAAIVVGVSLGSILSVAVVYGLGSTLVLLYPTLAVPCRLVGLRVRDVVRAAAPSLACAAAMAALVAGVDRWWLGVSAPQLRLAVGVAIGGLAYLALVTALRLTVARDLAAVARTHLRRRGHSVESLNP
jgi:PST family polysaccharide transporter